MYKRITLIIILCLSLVLVGCGSGSADKDEPVVGEWTAAGVFYEEQIYSFEAVPQLGELYDYDSITINADGTFSQLSHVFMYEGVWETFEVEGYDNAYMLKCETVSQLTGEPEASDTVKIAFIVEGDPNLLMVTDSDGEDEMPLLFLRNGTTSALLSGSSTSSYDSDTDDYDDYNYSDSYNDDSSDSYSSYNTATSGEQNALQKAWDYLDYSAFSYEGLIDQLEYEGFTYSEAKYAVDNCGADWYQQAAEKAQDYLDYSSFSRSELIDQLEYEGFTYDQAVYGVDAVY